MHRWAQSQMFRSLAFYFAKGVVTSDELRARKCLQPPAALDSQLPTSVTECAA